MINRSRVLFLVFVLNPAFFQPASASEKWQCRDRVEVAALMLTGCAQLVAVIASAMVFDSYYHAIEAKCNTFNTATPVAQQQIYDAFCPEWGRIRDFHGAGTFLRMPVGAVFAIMAACCSNVAYPCGAKVLAVSAALYWVLGCALSTYVCLHELLNQENFHLRELFTPRGPKPYGERPGWDSDIRYRVYCALGGDLITYPIFFAWCTVQMARKICRSTQSPSSTPYY